MENTHDEVVIPGELAHRLKAILMALEDVRYKKKKMEQHETFRKIASDLIIAEKLYSREVTQEELEAAINLIPS